MSRIEILRASYALQLLILSTGAHFQRVSEYYIDTRTFLWIGTTVQWDYVCFMYVATASRPFLRTHIFSAPAMPPTNMYQTQFRVVQIAIFLKFISAQSISHYFWLEGSENAKKSILSD